MRFLDKLKNRLIRRRYEWISRYLRGASPDKIVLEGERRAVKAFHRAAATVPAYGRLLRQRGVDPSSVNTIDDFKRKVPIVDKETVFADNELRDLCVGGTLDDVTMFFCSSGHSGVFSFGTRTRAEEKDAALVLEAALHNTFRTFDRKTLLINSLPMGVRIPTHSLPVSDTSVRTDAIVAMIRKLQDDFEQFILVGEHLLLKRIVEEGIDAAVPWQRLLVHCIMGGEYIPESFRTYLAHLLGVDLDRPETGVIGINYGLSEVSMTTFSENPHTVRIRRFANENPRFREALCGWDVPFCPCVMQTYPRDAYLETVPGTEGQDELAITTLDTKRKIPLVRYRTGDQVRILPYPLLARLLLDFSREDLIPPLPLRVGLIWGKRKWLSTGDQQGISPEHVKEAIYADFGAAKALTGNFRLKQADGGVRLVLQMQKGMPQADQVSKTVADKLRHFTNARPAIQTIAYEQFPYGFEHDFQRKCGYV